MATSKVIPPLPLNFEHAKQWFEQLDYIRQVHYPKVNLKAVFLANCGTECYQTLSSLVSPSSLSDSKYIFLFNDSNLTSGDNSDAKINLRTLLLDHLKPKFIVHNERSKFFQVKQVSKSIQEFVTELRRAAASCDFADSYTVY